MGAAATLPTLVQSSPWLPCDGAQTTAAVPTCARPVHCSSGGQEWPSAFRVAIGHIHSMIKVSHKKQVHRGSRAVQDRGTFLPGRRDTALGSTEPLAEVVSHASCPRPASHLTSTWLFGAGGGGAVSSLQVKVSVHSGH